MRRSLNYPTGYDVFLLDREIQEEGLYAYNMHYRKTRISIAPVRCRVASKLEITVY
jgi:hypothetical protein